MKLFGINQVLVYISLQGAKERIKVHSSSKKKGYEVIKLIRGRYSSMDDKKIDFEEAVIDENLKLM